MQVVTIGLDLARWSVRKGQILPDPARPVGSAAAPGAVGG
jgi:hypothetical protein